MEVQAAARLVGEGLGHHREHRALAFGQRVRGELEQRDVVGAGDGLGVLEVDLVLAVRVLVVGLLHLHAGGLQRGAQVGEEAALARQALQVVGRLVQAVAVVERQPLAVHLLEQEELGLDARLQRPAALGQALGGAAQDLARAVVEGLAGHEAVAGHAGHARHPGQRGERAQVGPRVVLAARPGAGQGGAPDRRAGEARAVTHERAELVQRHPLALGRAVHVDELREQRVHALLAQGGLEGGDLVVGRGAGHWPSRRIQVVLSSVYLSNACSDLSRPLPLCL